MKRALAFRCCVDHLYWGVQAPGQAQPAPPSPPTTKILAIGTVNAGVDPATVRAILPSRGPGYRKALLGWPRLKQPVVLASGTCRRGVHIERRPESVGGT